MTPKKRTVEPANTFVNMAFKPWFEINQILKRVAEKLLFTFLSNKYTTNIFVASS
jgi:hypothetical protein